MTAPGPLAKQHDAVFNILDADGNEQPIGPPKTAGQKHAGRVNAAKVKSSRTA